MKKPLVRCGADRIGEYESLFYGRKLGLVTNPSGVLADLTSTADKFARDYNLCAFYAPEHGVRGDRQDGQAVSSYIDEATGVPVHSIYGERRIPSQEALKEIGMMVFDIQDVGSRYYTFLYSMTNCMIACARKGIPFVVLDRPNMISGLMPEGTPMEPECTSFIGMYDFPQRYALTCGELAMMANEAFHIGAELTVVSMEGWKRDMYWEDTGLAWINPSPNIASVDAAVLYNGTCMFEGTTLSEGRGTTRPFELIGAPWMNAREYGDALNSLSCPGVYFRPSSFTPMFGKHAGKLCHGVQVHVTDRTEVRPVELGVMMVLTARDVGGEDFAFTPPRHERGDFTIDLLFGSPLLRTPNIKASVACQVIKEGTLKYIPRWERSLLYK